MLIALDDLHAADEPSLLLLRFLATSLHERPFVALGSYRETEPALREHAEAFGSLPDWGAGSRFAASVPMRSPVTWRSLPEMSRPRRWPPKSAA